MLEPVIADAPAPPASKAKAKAPSKAPAKRAAVLTSGTPQLPLAADQQQLEADGRRPPIQPARAAFVAFLLSSCRGALCELQARDAEVGVFNWALERADERRVARNWQNPRFRSLYESKARSVAANLCPNSYVANERVLKRLEDAEFFPHDIAGMHADHVFPERWREVVEAKVRRDEYMSTAKPAAMTDQFRCGRCKKRECSYMELQMRSCDEPASLFIQCLACGHRWRMG